MKKVERLFGPALHALPGPPAQFTLYLRKDSSELTGESAARIPEILRAIRERASVDVGVVGHTGWHLPGNAAYPEVRRAVTESLAWAALAQ